MATELYEKIAKKVIDELDKLNMRDEEIKIREIKGKWRIVYSNGITEINYDGYWTNIYYNIDHGEYTIEELIELYELIKIVMNKIDKKMEKLDKIINEL
jgi:hypothetical protein